MCPAWPCTVLSRCWCHSGSRCGLRELTPPPTAATEGWWWDVARFLRTNRTCTAWAAPSRLGCDSVHCGQSRESPQPQARAPPVLHTQRRRFPAQGGRGSGGGPGHSQLGGQQNGGSWRRALGGEQPPARESWVTSSCCVGASPRWNKKAQALPNSPLLDRREGRAGGVLPSPRDLGSCPQGSSLWDASGPRRLSSGVCGGQGQTGLLLPG